MRSWLSRVGELLFGRSRDERLSQEIEHHLEMLAEQHRARGLSDADARLAAGIIHHLISAYSTHTKIFGFGVPEI